MLGRRTRKATLVVHLLSAGAWIGVDVIVGVLVLVGRFDDDPAHRGAAYQALGLFVLWPMFTAGLACLLSGLLLGWGTKWGLLRYWWVAVKLALNLVLTSMVLLALRPALHGAVEHGRALAAGSTTGYRASDLFFPPAVSLAALSLATWLAVFKPWGRVRRRRAAAAAGPRAGR